MSMPKPPAETEKPRIALRFNPFALREAAPCFGPESDFVKLASLASATVATRRSFWKCEAEYNPLGKFGASQSRV